jgi:hypothetical protein
MQKMEADGELRITHLPATSPAGRSQVYTVIELAAAVAVPQA